MTRPDAPNLWTRLCQYWLEGTTAPFDPRLAADARMEPSVLPRMLSPLVGAWLH